MNKLKLRLTCKEPHLLFLASCASCFDVFIKALPQYANESFE